MSTEVAPTSITAIVEVFKKLEQCLQREVGFQIQHLDGMLRVRTPFLYRDNDYIELFILVTSDGITISDFGTTAEKVGVETEEQEFFRFLADWEQLSFDKSHQSLYKKVNKLRQNYSLLRRVIDFANRLQRIESIYSFTRENRPSVQIRTEHFIYIKSDKPKIGRSIAKQIEREIIKDWRKVVGEVVEKKGGERFQLVERGGEEGKILHYQFELEK